MSTSRRRVLGVVEVEARHAPSTTPDRDRAPRCRANGGPVSSPRFDSATNASCSATSAPLIAAVRVPPSASSTSQSSDDDALAERLEVGDRAQRAARSGAGSPARARRSGWCAACARRSARGSMRVLGRDPAACPGRAATAARGPRRWRCTARGCAHRHERRALGVRMTPRSILSGRSWRGLRPSRRGAPASARRARARGSPAAGGSRRDPRLRCDGWRALEPRQVGLVDDRDVRQRAAEERLARRARSCGGSSLRKKRCCGSRRSRAGRARRSSARGGARRLGARVDERDAGAHQVRAAAARSADSACSRGSGSRAAAPAAPADIPRATARVTGCSIQPSSMSGTNSGHAREITLAAGAARAIASRVRAAADRAERADHADAPVRARRDRARAPPARSRRPPGRSSRCASASSA